MPIPHTQRRFNGQANDGIVSLAEVSAPWLTGQIQLHIMHGLTSYPEINRRAK